MTGRGKPDRKKHVHRGMMDIDIRDLIREAYRCLKPGGRLAVIEMFFDQGSKTAAYLAEQGKIQASCESFVRFCESAGFACTGSEIVTTRKGPVSDGDLYPLDRDDRSSDRTFYFEKKA